MKLTRRRVLGGAAGLLGLTAAVRWLPRLLGGGPSDAEILIRELVRLVAVPDPVAAGVSYLLAAPAESDAGALTAHVLDELPLAGTASEVRHAFRERLAADFHAGRTVRADGWFLSETEAQLCALLALEVGALPRRGTPT